MAEKKKVIKPLYHVEIEAAAEELGERTLTEEQERNSKAFLRAFDKGVEIANENVFQITLKRAERLRIHPLSHLSELEREFLLSRQSKGSTEKTIQSYKDNFVRLYEFIGYTNLSDEVNKETAQSMRERYPDFTERRIGQLTPIMVLEGANFFAYFREYLLKVRELSIYTVESAMRHVRAIAYFARDNGWINIDKIPLIDTKPPIKATLSKKEMERLSKKPPIDNFVEYRTWVMIMFFASTGCRIGSVLGLNVEDIDFENRTITLSVGKDRTPKQMPLLMDLARVLREYVLEYRTDDSDMPFVGHPLFCNAFGERLAYRSCYDAFGDYYAARGIEWNGFHKFRHSYAANWVRQGGNAFMLKEQLGHSTLAMTNRYANIYGLATREEAEEFSLSRQMGSKTGRRAIRRKG